MCGDYSQKTGHQAGMIASPGCSVGITEEVNLRGVRSTIQTISGTP